MRLKWLPFISEEHIHVHVLVDQVQRNSAAAFGPKHFAQFGKYIQAYDI